MLTEVTVLKTHLHTKDGKPTFVVHYTEIHFDHEIKGICHIEVMDIHVSLNVGERNKITCLL